MTRFAISGVLFFVGAFVFCESALSAPADFHVKPRPTYETAEGTIAAKTFWRIFQTADFSKSDYALELLAQAAEGAPNDGKLRELVGLCRLWKVLEHNRVCMPSSDLHDLARQSLVDFEETVRLDPCNRLTAAFLSGAKYQVGMLEGNAEMIQEASCELEQSTNRFPQFHGFVQGWITTAMLPCDDPCYEHGLDAYFRTINSCAGGIKLSKERPRIGRIPFAFLAITSKKETVCYDSTVAPHNLEGTLLGLGDAFLKQGKLQQAKMVYETVRRVPAYDSWPYKKILEHRLDNMDCLSRKFRADSGLLDVSEPAMLFQSSISCTCCHATCNPASRVFP